MTSRRNSKLQMMTKKGSYKTYANSVFASLQQLAQRLGLAEYTLLPVQITHVK